MKELIPREYIDSLYNPQTSFTRYLFPFIRIVLFSLEDFMRHKCSLRASGLTYYTILSLVPMLAVGFGLAKGFGLEQYLERQLYGQFSQHRDFVQKAIEFAYSLLQSTQSGLIAGIGALVLFWTVLRVLGNIEEAFNTIWDVPHDRIFFKKIRDYLPILFLAPFFFIASSSLMVFIVTSLVKVARGYSLTESLSSYFLIGFQIFPLIISWVVLAFLYIYMPNTKVSYRSSIFAGIAAGTIYHVVQLIYIKFQIGVSSYGAIYGSFAALPLFFLWVYVSWLIILFGAELGFQIHKEELKGNKLSLKRITEREFGLWVMQMCILAFQRSQKPLSIRDIALNSGVDFSRVQKIIRNLIRGGLLFEVRPSEEKELRFQPSKNIQQLKVSDVCSALDCSQKNYVYSFDYEELSSVNIALEEYDNFIKKSPVNLEIHRLRLK